jgi:hypothetical protein
MVLSAGPLGLLTVGLLFLLFVGVVVPWVLPGRWGRRLLNGILIEVSDRWRLRNRDMLFRLLFRSLLNVLLLLPRLTKLTIIGLLFLLGSGELVLLV